MHSFAYERGLSLAGSAASRKYINYHPIATQLCLCKITGVAERRVDHTSRLGTRKASTNSKTHIDPKIWQRLTDTKDQVASSIYYFTHIAKPG